MQEIKEQSRIDELVEMVNNTKGHWDYEDKRDFIIDIMNLFLNAVLQNQPKVHLFTGDDEYEKKRLQYCHRDGKRANTFKSAKHQEDFERKYHWNQGDDLSIWLDASKQELELNLKQVKEKKSNYSNIITTPFQQQLIEPFHDEMENLSKDEIQSFDKVYYDFLEWILNKQIETINEYMSGKFEFKGEEYIQRTTKSEIGKIVLEASDKIGEVSAEIQKINQAKENKKNGK